MGVNNMKELIETISYYFHFPFVWYALIVGVLIALTASILGVTLVLKRYSTIGDGLSHVAFGALSVAAIVGLTNEMLLAMPITILAAILLMKSGQNAKIKGDAQLAMISVGAIAIGYLLINIFPTSSNITADVCSTLFGSISILTLSSTEVIICVVLSVVVLLFFILFYNKIFSITFDENFSKATGINTSFYNYLLAIIIAIVIVLAMNLVGSLLISALIVFPALSAMRVFKSFKSVIISSAIISIFSSIFGILSSILFSTPVGPTIVVVDILIFIIFFIVGLFNTQQTKVKV